jgi:hypothetical protein
MSCIRGAFSYFLTYQGLPADDRLVDDRIKWVKQLKSPLALLHVLAGSDSRTDQRQQLRVGYWMLGAH